MCQLLEFLKSLKVYFFFELSLTTTDLSRAKLFVCFSCVTCHQERKFAEQTNKQPNKPHSGCHPLGRWNKKPKRLPHFGEKHNRKGTAYQDALSAWTRTGRSFPFLSGGSPRCSLQGTERQARAKGHLPFPEASLPR